VPRPGRFTPGKEIRYPLYRRLGVPHGQSGRERKIAPPRGGDRPSSPAHTFSRPTCYTQYEVKVHDIVWNILLPWCGVRFCMHSYVSWFSWNVCGHAVSVRRRGMKVLDMRGLFERTNKIRAGVHKFSKNQEVAPKCCVLSTLPALLIQPFSMLVPVYY
jgi:hypothetical protein